MSDIDIDSLVTDIRATAIGEAPAERRVVHVYRSDRTSTAVAVIPPGPGFRQHLHEEHDEVIVYLEGEADLRLGDRIVPVRAGDVVSIPAGVPHGTAYAHTLVVLAATFSPGFDTVNEDRVYVEDLPPTADR